MNKWISEKNRRNRYSIETPSNRIDRNLHWNIKKEYILMYARYPIFNAAHDKLKYFFADFIERVNLLGSLLLWHSQKGYERYKHNWSSVSCMASAMYLHTYCVLYMDIWWILESDSCRRTSNGERRISISHEWRNFYRTVFIWTKRKDFFIAFLFASMFCIATIPSRNMKFSKIWNKRIERNICVKNSSIY